MGAMKEFPERVSSVLHRAVVTSGSHSLGTSSVNCLSEGRKHLMVLCRVAPSFRGGRTHYYRRCVNRRIRGGRGLLNSSSGIKAKEILHGASSGHLREGVNYGQGDKTLWTL